MKVSLRNRVLCTLLVFGFVILAGLPDKSHAYPVNPIIQEVLYDGPGIDADHVFTEIYGTPGLDLSGWTLEGVNGLNGSVYLTVDLTGAVLPGNGILVVAKSSFTALPPGSFFEGNVDWQNGPDAVVLRDPLDNVVDALCYGAVGSLPSWAYEGTPALDISGSQSLSRDRFGTDTDDNINDFFVLPVPTPGEVPIPGAFWLLGSGIVSLVGIRRKIKT